MPETHDLDFALCSRQLGSLAAPSHGSIARLHDSVGLIRRTMDRRFGAGNIYSLRLQRIVTSFTFRIDANIPLTMLAELDDLIAHARRASDRAAGE